MGVMDVFSEFGEIYLQSLLSTWLMTIVCFLGGLAMGILVTVMRVSPIKPLRIVGDIYVQIFRNIPTVSLLVIFVYALPYLGLLLDYRTCLVVCVILVVSSFASENFMSGINAIGVGQIEAARAVGLSFVQIVRLIVIPQALRTTVLPMTNLLIATLLTTALGSQVPLTPPELTGMVNYVNSRSVAGISAFVVSAICYAGTSLILGFLGNKLDEKVRIVR
ncbi:MAG: ABC transporter permease subunit [Atopobiaceae bacterium]|nr:ABC transporter permease subunit [Atopobiaceae bacterium]